MNTVDLSIKEIFCTDLSNVFVINDDDRRPAERFDLRNTSPNDLYYVSPFLCVGVDGGTSEIEMSNIRTFKNIFNYSADWVYETGGINQELIGVRLTCTDQAIISVLQNFFSDPIMDRDDCSLLLRKKEEETWSRSLKELFLKKIGIKFRTHFKDVPEDPLLQLYNALKILSQSKGTINGQSFFINLDNLLESLYELPEFLKSRSIR